MKKFLEGHICLVTGGTQGIGWAIVQALADHGGQVYACGRSEESVARATAELAMLPWGEAISLAQCDVTDRAAFEEWIDSVVGETGRVDVLVHNAAFVRWVDVMDMTVEEAEQTMQVGYNALVYGAKKVLPLMLGAGRGHIVTIGSIAGHILVTGPSAAYAAAKAAVDAYSQILQVELRGTPVRATVVRLGTVAGTDFFKKYVPATRLAPLSRFFPALTPPQVARAVVRAIDRKQNIVTLPRYLRPLSVVYRAAPGFSRWLVGLGGKNDSDYGGVEWEYRRPPR
ncbi:MAG: SDR family oxidoreductase [Chloroflexi bacterium]|nr:SDR family oxidoreductase [Chloroflexota bacterium]MCI0580410.1 SDR family oxidoreductase [Chloroflexota bacterium]MCI0650181.1 SDR family oxidoreductase [Chloroflexota bacterium]MCI0729508.1 SDR family oxidoreductase [Chloroflexota bacterium]